MTPALRRPARLAATAAVAALLCSGCGPGPNLMPRRTAGTTGRSTIVLMVAPTRAAVLAGVDAFVKGRGSRIVSAVGTPAEVATSVKDGAVVDAVVLPSGPDLDRVRNELVAAPLPLGTVAGTPYWAAPVTYRGLVFAQFLQTPQGRSLLHAHGVTGSGTAG